MSAPAVSWQPVQAWTYGLNPAGDAAVDAYLLWDLCSGFARHAWRHPGRPVPGVDATVPLLVELASDPAGDQTARALRALSPALADALDASLRCWPGTRFHTGLAVRDMVLQALVAATAQGLLVRWQLGADCRTVAPPAVVAPEAVDDPRRSLHTLGIVDDGCCLAHALYRGADGTSRFAWVWDQDPGLPSPAPWMRAPAPGGGAGLPLVHQGAELARPQIESLLARHPELGQAAEQELYQALGRPSWGTPGHTHGARVTHLMAAAAQAHGWQADGGDIAFVQLPHGSLADTSGPSIPMQVLDGARYIVARAGLAPAGAAAAPATTPRRSATVCLSLGGTAGPHDGSSMVEQALDELAAIPGVDVVVAAGNLPAPRSADPARWLHGQRTIAPGRQGRFLVHVAGGNARHAFVELWIPDNVSGHHVDPTAFRVQVQAPGLAPCAPLRCGQVHLLRPAGADAPPVAGLLFVRRVAQGRQGSLVLLAVGATAAVQGAAAGQRLAPAGVWAITVQSQASQTVTVHGWVERDDGFVPPRRSQQTWFERDGDDPPDAPYVNDACTLSSLANGRRVVVAGGYVASSGEPVDTPLRARRRGTDNRTGQVAHALAPTDRGTTRRGVQVPGFYSGHTTTIRGSSAAAPQVARWMAAGPDAEPPPLPHGVVTGHLAPHAIGDAAARAASTSPIRHVRAR